MTKQYSDEVLEKVQGKYGELLGQLKPEWSSQHYIDHYFTGLSPDKFLRIAEFIENLISHDIMFELENINLPNRTSYMRSYFISESDLLAARLLL